MAVVMQMVFEGVGLPEYVKVNAKVIEAGEPEGLLFHAAGEGPDGLRVVDIWESSAAFEAFSAAALQDAIAGSGLAGVRPQVESWELGNVWVPDGETLAGMSNFGMR
jgi:hypothetical protein